jgi:hypothetical protein
MSHIPRVEGMFWNNFSITCIFKDVMCMFTNLYLRTSKDLSVGDLVDGNFVMVLHSQNHQQSVTLGMK